MRATRLSAGALGYVLKESAESELVEAIRRAAAGDTYLNPRLGARVAAEPPPGLPDGLSEREVEVLRMIALGHTNAEIAEQLYLSVRTVETHRAHIQQKLGLAIASRARPLRARPQARRRLSSRRSRPMPPLVRAAGEHEQRAVRVAREIVRMCCP